MPQTRFWYLLAKKISGEASSEEIQELSDLIKQNPDWAYQAEHIFHFWKFKKENGKQEAEQAFEKHLLRMRESGIDLPQEENAKPDFQFNHISNRKKIVTYSLSIAAVALFLIAGIFWLTSDKKKSPLSEEKNFSEISSPIGSKTKLILPDSTVVWLNAGSKLTYNEQFGTTNRDATLIGEAFFDVKHGAIPFIIHANGIHIKDLGTVFNVKAYPDEKTIETSLIKGKVEITLDKRPGELHILEPNEKLIVSNVVDETKAKVQNKDPLVVLRGLTRTTDSTIVETSWVNNELIFQDEDFRQIAMKMEKWYGIAIEFKDEKIANERLSGTFTSENVQEALTALQLTTKFHYIIKGNLITITQ